MKAVTKLVVVVSSLAVGACAGMNREHRTGTGSSSYGSGEHNDQSDQTQREEGTSGSEEYEKPSAEPSGASGSADTGSGQMGTMDKGSMGQDMGHGSMMGQGSTQQGTGSSGVDVNASPRAQRDAILDDLYKRYGGGETSRQLKQENARTGTSGDQAKELGKDVKEGVSSAVTKADRAAFLARCTAVGRGQEPMWGGDDRAKAFFQQADVKAKCAEVARLSDKIEQEDRAPAPAPTPTP